MRKRFWASLGLLTGMTVGSGTASAADSPLADASGTLEEIVVTAEKRETTAQKTPIAITAVMGEDIASRAQYSLDEVIRDTPSVEVQAGAGGATVFIRGIGTNDTGFGDPAINLNIDGVYQQDPGPVTGGLYDVNRIEVLRGPQGTLYGRNATAGSINIVTNDPLQEFEASTSIAAGNYSQVRAEGMLNVPVSDRVALRGAFFTDRHDAYLEPSGYDDLDQKGGRIKALFSISDAVRLVMSGSYLSETGEGKGTVNTGIDDRSDAWTAVRTPGVTDREYVNLSAQLDWNLGAATLTFLPAYTKADLYDNASSLPASVLVPAQGEQPIVQSQLTEQTSLELRLASTGESALSWVGGLYYIDGTYKRDDDGPYRLANTPVNNPALYQRQPLESYAAFGQVTYALTESLRLTGGLRYTNDEKAQFNQYRNYTTGIVTDSPSQPKSWDSLDYKVGAEVDLSPTSMLYATVSTAYKSGGFSTRVPQGSPSSPYDPEDLFAYEVGVKNRFMGSRLQVNAAAYHYDYEGYQVKFPIILPGQGIEVRTANAGEATIYGAELEAILQVGSADRVDVSAAYTNAEFGTLQYVGVAGAVDRSGQVMPNAPEWMGTVGYEHIWDVARGELRARLQSKISSGYWSTVEQTQDSYQPSYTRSDASLVYAAPANRWSVRAYIKNIENEALRSGGGFASPDRGFLYLQPPRTYGVGATMNF